MIENRRADDPWKERIYGRIERLEERIEKNNLMTEEMLGAWNTVKGGMRALELLAKVLKVLAAIGAAGIALWQLVGKVFGRG